MNILWLQAGVLLKDILFINPDFVSPAAIFFPSVLP